MNCRVLVALVVLAVLLSVSCAGKRMAAAAKAGFVAALGVGSPEAGDVRAFDLGWRERPCRHMQRPRYVAVADSRHARLYCCENPRRTRYHPGGTYDVTQPDGSVRRVTVEAGNYATLGRSYQCMPAVDEGAVARRQESRAVDAVREQDTLPDAVLMQFYAQAEAEQAAEVIAKRKRLARAQECCDAGGCDGVRTSYCLAAGQQLGTDSRVVERNDERALHYLLAACKGEAESPEWAGRGCNEAARSRLLANDPARACSLAREACRIDPEGWDRGNCALREQLCAAVE